MVRAITGFSNPLVKQVKALRDKKQRRAAGLFLAEGLRILTEAHEAGRVPEMLWHGPGAAGHPLLERLALATVAGGGEVFETSPEILARLSGKDNPGLALGVYREWATDIQAIDPAAADIWFVAQAMRDPGNLGTLLRTGDAVGAGGVILIDHCTDPFSVEAVRASMGALFTQQIAHAPWAEFLDWVRPKNGEAPRGGLVALSLNTTTDYQAPRYRKPSFILIGNEARGLPSAYEAACDQLVRIPMCGKADSLNAAVAGAVMAYEVRNQLRRAIG